MTWDKPITADGHTATPEQLQEAWDKWAALTPPRDSGHLVGRLVWAGAGNDERPWRCSRVADRMLQRARKAGVIEFRKGVWRFVEDQA